MKTKALLLSLLLTGTVVSLIFEGVNDSTAAGRGAIAPILHLPAALGGKALRPTGDPALDLDGTMELRAIYAQANAALNRVQNELDAGYKRRLLKLELMSELEAFIEKHPASVWTPEVSVELGLAARLRGNYSKAVQYYSRAWNQLKDASTEPGASIAEEAIAPLGKLLALLGRVDILAALEAEVAASGKIPRGGEWALAVDYARWLRKNPNDGYKCGLYAIDQLGRLTQPGQHNSLELLKTQSMAAGFSAAKLWKLGRDFGLRLLPVRLNEFADLPIPSIVHLQSQHYVIIRERRGDFYEVIDPVAPNSRWLTAAEIAEDATGCLIVSELSSAPDIVAQRIAPLTEEEAAEFIGRCTYITDYNQHNCPGSEAEEEDCDGCGPEGGGGNWGNPSKGPFSGYSGAAGPVASMSGCDSCGMPGWSVDEPTLNLWLTDIPIEYKPGFGPTVRLRLTHPNRPGNSTLGLYHDGSTAGYNWRSSWLSYGALDDSGNQAELLTPEGSWAFFNFPVGSNTSDLNYYRNVWLEKIHQNQTLIGLRLWYRNGYRVEYTYSHSGLYFMEKQFDKVGNFTRFVYSGNALTNVIAADGVTFAVRHNNPNFTNIVTDVSASYGGTVKLRHGESRNGAPVVYDSLTTIVDAANITNLLNYGYYGIPVASVVTPYGTTTFSEQTSGNFIRALRITLPNSAEEFYGVIPEYWGTDWPAFNSAQIPTNTPVGTLDTGLREQRNSFYWNAKQFETLRNTPLENFGWNHFKKGRIRHWLLGFADMYTVDETLSWEQAPSPNGSTEGQITWSDHATKPVYSTHERPTNQILPSLVAQVRPDGSTWYTYYVRNGLGKPIQEIEKWCAGTATHFRTNTFIYDSTGMDLLVVKGAGGAVEAGYAYDVSHPHLPVRITNAVNEVTKYAFDTSHRLVTTEFPSGLVSSNTYGSAFLQRTVDYANGAPFRTNSYTWENGLIKTHTDDRGLTITNNWDYLRRLLSRYYPDGTYTQNTYYLYPGESYPNSTGGTNLLDLTAARDRMGRWTDYDYTEMRQLARIVDANTNVTTFGYCSCGVLEYQTNAPGTILQMVTQHVYDEQSKLLITFRPGNINTTNAYDLPGRLTTVSDSSGSIGYYYDNLNRPVAISNYFGQVERLAYDSENQVTNRTDMNGVTTASTYDGLGRLRTKTLSGGGTEEFGYTANVSGGPTSHTSALGKVTQYSYHAAGWKTNEVQVGMSTNRFTHNPAGDLRTLSDGKSQLTSWGYDAYGRVTSKTNHNNLEILRYKYDANSRLTNRWSSTKLNTYYDYDAVGNLTNVNYNASTDLRYKYDALGRMTNMVDAAGTTSWYYDPANRRVVEDGPWADDNVTNILNTAGLLATVGVQQPSGSFNAAYAYDSARRLSTVTATSGTFNYYYVPSLNSVTAPTRLVHRITLPNTSFVTNFYDNLARLTDTYLRKNDGTSSNRHSYVYNNGHQRTRQTYFNGDYVDYLYDDAGQLYSAKTYNSGGSAIAAQNYGFAYDPAANLNRKTNNVTVTASVLNSLNQVMTNGGAIYTYDNNGNRSTRHDNGMSRYTYDDENQLVVADKDPATYSGAPKTELIYDGKMRLRKRLEYQWNGSLWNLQSETRYLYSGMLAVQERNSSNVPVTTYTRGTDLSGTFDGAGGIGGLLARSHGYSSGSWSDHNFYHADGNGNVTYLVNSSQAMAASYRYEPFGHTITSSGPLAAANLYRFSSKEFLTNSVLYYYGYRFYDPMLQRWQNRDPLEEFGGLNLFRFVRNNPVTRFDPFGDTCGSKEDGSTSEYFIPDNPFGHNFSQACQNHDNCYGDCSNGKSRQQCDDQFLADMYKACDSNNNPIVRPRCKQIADKYYEAVRNFGKKAWTHARAKCDCG